MEIRDSVLSREIDSVLSGGTNPVHYTVQAFLIVNNQSYPCRKVISIDFERDYKNNYHDSPILKAQIERGVYYTYIQPYMDAVECVIRQYPIGEVSQGVDYNQSIQEERFVAVLHTQGSPYLEHNERNIPSQESLDLSGLLDFEVELIPYAAHQIRMMTVSPGVLRQVTPEVALRAILTQESKRVQIQNRQAITGIDIIPSNNQTLRKTVMIPERLVLGQIPAWVHEECGGLYSAGLGYYLQGQTWYVYPLFDPVRNAKQAPVLTIVNVPKNQYPTVERTYRTYGDHSTILSTGSVKYRDVSPVRQLNRGSGLRWTDANVMATGYAQTQDNKAVAFRSKTNFEVMGSARPDGMSFAPVSNSGPTANPFFEYAKLAENNGAYLTLTWENSEPNLIKPGMLVRVLYLNQGQVASMQGVLLKAQHYRRMSGVGFAADRYITDTAITLFVQRAMADGFVTSQPMTQTS